MVNRNARPFPEMIDVIDMIDMIDIKNDSFIGFYQSYGISSFDDMTIIN